jgi:hypothetical protein
MIASTNRLLRLPNLRHDSLPGNIPESSFISLTYLSAHWPLDPSATYNRLAARKRLRFPSKVRKILGT